MDITRTTRRYARLSRLDFDALDYRGLWDWRLGRRWSGTLGTERSQSLADYSEFHDSSRRNVLTVERTFLSAWRIWRSGSTAALKLRQLDVDQPLDPVTQLDDGFKRSAAELSVTWAASARSTVESRIARVDYRSNHFAQCDFSGSAAALDATWQLAARTAPRLSLARQASDFRNPR